MKKYPVSDKEAWEGHADCLSCTLRNSVLFAGLEEKDFERVLKQSDQSEASEEGDKEEPAKEEAKKEESEADKKEDNKEAAPA